MHFSRDNFPSFTSKTLNPKEGILFILEMLRNIDSDWHLYSSTGSSISEVQEWYSDTEASDFLLFNFTDIVCSMYSIIYLIFLNFILSNIASVINIFVS